MTEIELLVDFHKNAERQGPGSSDETLKALELIDLSQNKDLRIADLGCGTGGQTITVAQNVDGKVYAVDLFADFLNILKEKSKEYGVYEKINILEESMENLPFDKEYFDIIWSEGAIYNIGFEAGIRKWKEYLKPDGYLSVSEITWITNSRPKEIEDFWNHQYPEIDTASNKIKTLEDNGYTLVGYFYLAQDSWIKNYYNPIEDRFRAFLENHNNSEMAQNIIKEYKKEIRIYKRYKDYYSYGFYIAKKNR